MDVEKLKEEAGYLSAAKISDAAKHAATQLPAPASKVLQLPLTSLIESPTNPRKTFARMDELIQSITSSGVLDPLIVRKVPKMELYEIVAGHRRYRAATKAEIETVPCDVRVLSDLQVLEIQIMENTQRADLSELEEAEAYAALRDIHFYSADQIALKCGTSKGIVYARLRLTTLCGEAKKALADGLISSAIAIPLARLPSHNLQAKALDAIKKRSSGDKIHAVEAVAWLTNEYSRALKNAPFQLTDETLVPEAGACAVCPKNSKCATPGLFDDLKQSGQVCTDSVCFDSKSKAAWVKKSASEVKKGAKALTIDQGSKLFPHGENLGYASKYVDLAGVCGKDSKKRTWGELYESIDTDKRPGKFIAPDRDMKGHLLAIQTDLVKAIADELGYKWAQSEIDSGEASNASPSKESKGGFGEEVIQNKTEYAMIAPLALAISKDLSSVPVAFLKFEFDRYFDDSIESLNLGLVSGSGNSKENERAISKLKPNQMIALWLFNVLNDIGTGDFDTILAFAKSQKVDVDSIEKTTRAKVEAELLMKPKGKK